jgi:hypothetical protein
VNGEKLEEMNMADRWSSPRQDGSKEQYLSFLTPDVKRVVCRCSCHKGKGMSPGSH